MSKKQVIVLLSILFLTGFLYSLDIKKAGKPAGDNKPSRKPVSSENPGILPDIDSLESREISILNPQEVKNVKLAKSETIKKPGFDTYTELGNVWSKTNKSFWAGHYYFKAAAYQSNLKNWLKAGDYLNESLALTQDTLAQRIIFRESNKSFLEALKIDSTNLDAKTGLGVSYVAGGENPMQGIGLLLQVVSQDPNNVKANFSLGLFSMKSGQYQKAINRFKVVINQKPSGEAYFYLAQAYQNLDLKKEAAFAYLQSKKYIDDPQTLTSIDHMIKDLTN